MESCGLLFTSCIIYVNLNGTGQFKIRGHNTENCLETEMMEEVYRNISRASISFCEMSSRYVGILNEDGNSGNSLH